MLWSISIITMRKESNKSILDVPLHFSRGDKLINDNLGTIGKVTKLSFPQTEGIRMGLGIS